MIARTRARRTPLGLRLLTAPAVAAITLTGLWLTGGQITNDFGAAMWLSAGWMALAAAGCLAVAVRSPALRAPVLGAYLVTALAAGAYLGAPMFFDDVVDERVATAEPPAASAPGGGSSGGGDDDHDEAAAPTARNELLRRGTFVPVRHEARGEAQVIRLASGGRVLTVTGFEVDNGPDLRVYLVAGRPRSEGDVRDFVDLGALRGNKGDQQYRIPASVDVGHYSTAVVWCRAFSVLFTRAPLAPG